MTDEEKRVKKALKNWAIIKNAVDLKQYEINIMQKIIDKGNISIELAEKEICRLEGEIKTILENHNDIGEKIAELTAEEQKIVHYRYLKKYSWRKIEHLMYLSERQLFMLQKKLLNKLKI